MKTGILHISGKIKEKFPDVADEIIQDYNLYPYGVMDTFIGLLAGLIIDSPEFVSFVNKNYIRKIQHESPLPHK